MANAVLLRPGGEPVELLALLAREAATCRAQPDQALSLARRWGPQLPRPGSGRTRDLWEALATLGAVDLTVARACEPHLDALAILHEAGRTPADETWGVYAAEGAGIRLRAEHGRGTGWQLSGTKPWCSLADQVTHALLTAWVDDRSRGLFAVDLAAVGVRVLDEAEQPWVARGLSAVRSGGVAFDDVPATPVGGPQWYLRRDGFAWGGMGVAAIWYGGAVGLARRMLRQRAERDPDQVALMHLGTVDAALWAARSVLAAAAAQVDAGRADGEIGARLALRVRQVVADTVERVLLVTDHALGPGPLTGEEEYAARVADLRVYVRQHHGERDTAQLGRTVSPDQLGVAPW